ncbi:ATP synthase I subunit [Lacrimispora xylanisolvens]|uniref:ATP synthase I subunit n=1 Tax=Lacrimispora xylanisolvens TaxID=384636 RepID=A0A2S6HYG1_9FIRM|nr:ATP synthase subunit I [Hungatella xylanolytica]PPK83193.1 ATP synthase I subunit [Hungatella xylanolytica]
MEKVTKNLIIEVLVGIVIFTVAAMLAALFLYPKPSVFAGLLLGMLLALSAFLSMALVLVNAMKSSDPKIVQRNSIIGTSIRYLLLIAILVIVIVYFQSQINPVALVIGVFGLKAGAFLQPVIHKITVRFAKRN